MMPGQGHKPIWLSEIVIEWSNKEQTLASTFKLSFLFISSTATGKTEQDDEIFDHLGLNSLVDSEAKSGSRRNTHEGEEFDTLWWCNSNYTVNIDIWFWIQDEIFQNNS